MRLYLYISQVDHERNCRVGSLCTYDRLDVGLLDIHDVGLNLMHDVGLNLMHDVDYTWHDIWGKWQGLWSLY